MGLESHPGVKLSEFELTIIAPVGLSPNKDILRNPNFVLELLWDDGRPAVVPHDETGGVCDVSTC